jgi:proline iminopeptidase
MMKRHFSLILAATLAAVMSIAAYGAQAPTASPGQAQAPGVDASYSRAEVQEIIRDARRIIQPRGVEELKPVDIGGIQQWISVRGRDRRNPILLFIHGGPGSPEMPASWLYQSGWEDYFTVVQWDQRAAGKTNAANDIAAVAPTINADRMRADAEELISYLRKEYRKDKIFVLGHSWGSIIGLEIARRHPEWLHAYMGMGQAIYKADNERVGYQWVLRQARARKDEKAIRELEALAPYPEADGTVSMAKVLVQRKWGIEYGGLTWGRSSYEYEQNLGKLSPEYSDRDLSARGGRETLQRLMPDLNRTDFRSITKLDTPLFIFAGRYDYQTPSQVAAAWFAKVSAPAKRIFWFEHSAHVMHMEQPGKFLMHLIRDVRPLAERVGDAAPEDSPMVDK